MTRAITLAFLLAGCAGATHAVFTCDCLPLPQVETRTAEPLTDANRTLVLQVCDETCQRYFTYACQTYTTDKCPEAWSPCARALCPSKFPTTLNHGSPR